MKIIQVYSTLRHHKLWNKAARKRFMSWQLTEKKQYPEGKEVQWVDDAKIIITQGRPSATGCYYLGLFEFNEMGFWYHYLRNSDTFVDIGANIGAYSVLGGLKASGISVEPAKDTYDYLIRNLEINNIKNVITENVGLSDKRETLKFSIGQDSTNHVLNDAEIKDGVEYIEIPVLTLDEVIEKNGKDKVSALKIDVEGFEEIVIAGGKKTLENPWLNIIICEVFSDSELCKMICSYGFRQYTYNPFSREIEETKYAGINNSIFIRDIDFARERVKSAPKIKVYDWEI